MDTPEQQKQGDQAVRAWARWRARREAEERLAAQHPWGRRRWIVVALFAGLFLMLGIVLWWLLLH